MGSVGLRREGKGNIQRCCCQGANSSWMEDRFGNRVNSERQKKILKEMRATWQNMEGFNIAVKPIRCMPVTSLNYFRARTEAICLELQLCADHWKADQLWKENFSASVFRKGRGRNEVRFNDFASSLTF